jgi:hypothetical protein
MGSERERSETSERDRTDSRHRGARRGQPGKGSYRDEGDGPDDEAPISQPGPVVRAEPWEADDATMAAFGMTDGGAGATPVQKSKGEEKKAAAPAEAKLTASPTRLKFSAELHGSTPSRSAALTNSSGQALVIGGVMQEVQPVGGVVRPPGDFKIEGIAPGVPIAPGGSAPDVVVTFQPQVHFDDDTETSTRRKVKLHIVDTQQRDLARIALRGEAEPSSDTTQQRYARETVKEIASAGKTPSIPRTYTEMLSHLEAAGDLIRADSYADAIPLLRTVDDQLESRCNVDKISAAAAGLRAIGRSVSQATSDVSAAKIGVFDLLGRALAGATIAVDHDLDAFRSAREVLEILLPESKEAKHEHTGFTQTVVVDPGSLPQVDGLDLPTTSPFDSEIEIDDLDAGRKHTMSRNGLLASPSFVDNATSIAPRGSNWLTLEVQSYELMLSNGHTARVSFSDIDVGKGRARSDKFRETGGVIYPLTDDGSFAFDTTNTPHIIAAARTIDDLILRAKNDRVLYAWAVLGFQISLAELATAVNAEGVEAPRSGKSELDWSGVAKKKPTADEPPAEVSPAEVSPAEASEPAVAKDPTTTSTTATVAGDTAWSPPPEASAKVPAEWGGPAPTKKGVGVRWEDPSNPGNGIRIDRGNPDNSQAVQQVDHVVVRSGGKVIGRDGKPISGSVKDNFDTAHIPLSEWLTWARWNSPK